MNLKSEESFRGLSPLLPGCKLHHGCTDFLTLKTFFQCCRCGSDPAFHFDADPDPSFQIKAQNLEKVIKWVHIPHILACHLNIDVDVDPDPTYHSDADPDPAYPFDADPDPTFQFYADQCGSGSTTLPYSPPKTSHLCAKLSLINATNSSIDKYNRYTRIYCSAPDPDPIIQIRTKMSQIRNIG
jgi:hypothetical protein